MNSTVKEGDTCYQFEQCCRKQRTLTLKCYFHSLCIKKASSVSVLFTYALLAAGRKGS